MNGLKAQTPTDLNIDGANTNSDPKPPLFCMLLVNLVFFRPKMFDASVLTRSITKCKSLYYKV